MVPLVSVGPYSVNWMCYFLDFLQNCPRKNKKWTGCITSSESSDFLLMGVIPPGLRPVSKGLATELYNPGKLRNGSRLADSVFTLGIDFQNMQISFKVSKSAFCACACSENCELFFFVFDKINGKFLT